MAHYRIHRIKETPKETFRWAAHTGGLAIVKIKDYEVGDEVEAATAYAAWHMAGGGPPVTTKWVTVTRSDMIKFENADH